MLKRICLSFVCVIVFAVFCSFQRSGDLNNRSSEVAQEETFPYPVIPSLITDPEGRAAYLLTHYWERVDFNRHRLSDKDAMMEQGFVDFLSVFPHVEASVLPQAIRNLLKLAMTDNAKVQPLVDLVENYLYHPNSPMLNEEYYGLFIQELLTSSRLSLETREKLKFQLNAVNKNRVGSQVSDFSFLDASHRTERLYTIKASQILLFFYDADCEECKYVLSQMKKNTYLKNEVSSNRLKVVTVCVEGGLRRWMKTIDTFPQAWVKGCVEDFSSLLNGFVFRAMPTIYLLDKNKKVILKDVPWVQLVNYWNA